MAKLNMVKALNLALMQEMERDPDVLVIGEDVGVDGGVFRVTEDLHRAYGSKRVIDSPLAEAGI
ncbi:MAG: alpha-ketoacid dehydrogenase subunit beta, partial [Candidatus Rokuibacteriota bacterium]